MTSRNGSAPGRPPHLGVKPVGRRPDTPGVTHIRQRFRALPRRLRLLVWIGIATGVGTGIAIPVSSTHGGHGGPVTAHGAAAPAAGTSTTVPPTTATTAATTTTATTTTATTTTAKSQASSGVSSAESELSRLRIAAEGPRTGYERSLFPQWIDADHDGCDTRHEVLIAESVVPAHVGAGCTVTGRWYSAYDGVTTSDASTFDIDHVVPLADAWRTGASSWTTAQRQAFANDLTDPQLIAVTDNVNQEKGDKSPDQWKPPLVGYWCTYAKMWVAVKYKFKLTINSAEKTALTDMLNRC